MKLFGGKTVRSAQADRLVQAAIRASRTSDKEDDVTAIHDLAVAWMDWVPEQRAFYKKELNKAGIPRSFMEQVEGALKIAERNANRERRNQLLKDYSKRAASAAWRSLTK